MSIIKIARKYVPEKIPRLIGATNKIDELKTIADDSDQTTDLADSLIRCGGLNVEDPRSSLRRSVIAGKSLLWDGKATDSGGSTRNARSDVPEKVRFALTNNIGTNDSFGG